MGPNSLVFVELKKTVAENVRIKHNLSTDNPILFM